MKKGRVVLLAVIVIIAIGVVGIVIPTKYSVARTVVVNADEATTHEVLTDMEMFVKWNPWSQLDPDMEVSYYGDKGQVGHGYNWDGDKETVGKGQLEIMAISPEIIEMKLTFLDPWESVSPTGFNLVPVENGTEVTWWMEGEIPLLMSFMQDMEGMIGSSFEQGLDTLVVLMDGIEKPAENLKVVDLPTMTFVGNKQGVKISELDGVWDIEEIENLYRAIGGAGAQGGFLTSLYFVWEENNDWTEMAVASVVPEGTIVEGFATHTVEAGPAVVYTHKGSYERLDEAYMALMAYIEDQGLEYTDKPAMEIYKVGVSEGVDESEYVTDIIFPIASKEAAM